MFLDIDFQLFSSISYWPLSSIVYWPDNISFEYVQHDSKNAYSIFNN